MRHEEVRGLFARTLNTPPVPATGTDAIVAEGRKLERRRRTAAYGGSTLAAVVAVAVGVALLQPGGGSGPGIDGAEGPAASWNTSGEPDPNSDYHDALAQAVGENMPEAIIDAEVDPPFVFAWNEDKTAIASQTYVKLDGADSLYLDVTIQEPKSGDVEARLEELAGCAGDCARSELGDGRHLLTKEDQRPPDAFGPRSRLWALVSRPDGTVATGALWVDDDTPGTIELSLEQLVNVIAALPDTTTAPVGGPEGEPAPESSETNPGNIAAMLDEALAGEVERQFPDSQLTDYTGYEGFDQLGFKYGETIDGWRSDGLILVATPPNMSVLAEVYDELSDPVGKIPEMAKCDAFGGCAESDGPDGEKVFTVKEAGEFIAVWIVRDDDSIARVTISAVEDAPLAATDEQVTAIALALPFL